MSSRSLHAAVVSVALLVALPPYPALAQSTRLHVLPDEDVHELIDSESVEALIKTTIRGKPLVVAVLEVEYPNSPSAVRTLDTARKSTPFDVIWLGRGVTRQLLESVGQRLGLPRPYYLLNDDATPPQVFATPTYIVYDAQGTRRATYAPSESWSYATEFVYDGQRVNGYLPSQLAAVATRMWADKTPAADDVSHVVRSIRLAVAGLTVDVRSASPRPTGEIDAVITNSPASHMGIKPTQFAVKLGYVVSDGEVTIVSMR